MKAWFADLQPRERIFVATAAVSIVLTAFWFGLWRPLDDGQKSAAARVESWSAGIAALRPLKPQIQAMSSSGTPAVRPDQSLVVIVDTTLRQRGLYSSMQRSQPTPGGDGIRIEFENAAFDDLILWIGDLHVMHGLDVESGSFSTAPGDNPGRVNSSVTLQR